MDVKRHSLGVFDLLIPKFEDDNELLDLEKLKSYVSKTVERGVKNVCLDLTDCQNLDNDSVSTIKELNKIILRSTGRLTILAKKSSARDTLDSLGLSSILRIYESEEEISSDSKDILKQTESYYMGNIKQAGQTEGQNEDSLFQKNEFDILKNELSGLINTSEDIPKDDSVLETVQEQPKKPEKPKPINKESNTDSFFIKNDFLNISEEPEKDKTKEVTNKKETPTETPVIKSSESASLKRKTIQKKEQPIQKKPEKSKPVKMIEDMEPEEPEDSKKGNIKQEVDLNTVRFQRFEDEENKSSKSSKKSFLIPALLIFLVICGGIIAYLQLSPKVDKTIVKRPSKYVEIVRIPKSYKGYSGNRTKAKNTAQHQATKKTKTRQQVSTHKPIQIKTKKQKKIRKTSTVPTSYKTPAPRANITKQAPPKIAVEKKDDLNLDEFLEDDEELSDEPVKVARPVKTPVPSSVAKKVVSTNSNIKSKIFISSSPPTADILKDGKIIGVANRKPVVLTVGTHHLVLRKGSIEKEVDIEIKEGKNRPIFIKLR